MRWRRSRGAPAAPEAMTPAQVAAARDLARETLQDDHLAIERYAGIAVPRLVPEKREEGGDAQA